MLELAEKQARTMALLAEACGLAWGRWMLGKMLTPTTIDNFDRTHGFRLDDDQHDLFLSDGNRELPRCNTTLHDLRERWFAYAAACHIDPGSGPWTMWGSENSRVMWEVFDGRLRYFIRVGKTKAMGNDRSIRVSGSTSAADLTELARLIAAVTEGGKDEP